MSGVLSGHVCNQTRCSEFLDKIPSDEKVQVDNMSNDDTCVKKMEEVECDEAPIGDSYTCGGCGLGYPTICKLHMHLRTHGHYVSYFYLEDTKTAYPKFRSRSISIQTDDESSVLKTRKKTSKTTKKNYDQLFGVKYENTDKVGKQNKDSVKVSDLSNNIKESSFDDVQSLERDFTQDSMEPEDAQLQSKTDIGESRAIREIKLKRKGKLAEKKAFKRENKTDFKNIKSGNPFKMTVKLSKAALREKKKIPIKKSAKKVPQTEAKSLEEKFECKLCNIEFEKRIYLRNHLQCKHLDVPFLCMFCGELCETETGLIKHRKSTHRQGYHKCELCDKVLSTKAMLDGHYLVHKGIKPFSCDICSPKREFTRKSQLKSHMETHSEEKNLQCEFCGKPFNARYLMLNHVKHCAGIKPYHCEFCEMKFVSNHCLQRHRRIHTGEKPFVCEVCAFASSNASCLARHMRTHTGEKPFVCKHCNQAFAAPGALKKHVRIHTQEKPYKCIYCEKAFTQKWNLKTHERQHTGETPYRCHICGIGYKQNVLLKTHLKTHYSYSFEQSTSQASVPGSQSTTLESQSSIPESQSAVLYSAVNYSSANQQTGSHSDNIKNEPLDQQIHIQSASQIQQNNHSVVDNLLMKSLAKPSFKIHT